ENVDMLIKCVTEDLGYSQGKPVAAFTIYKCLLHWKSFEAERTSVFDRLIQMIGSTMENPDSNEHMAYWLSNTSTLLFLLQRSLKDALNLLRDDAVCVYGFRSSLSSSNLSADVVRQVEAKYPALLFKQQLTAYVEKIYGIIRDNLKRDLGPLLSSCIQGACYKQCNCISMMINLCRILSHQIRIYNLYTIFEQAPRTSKATVLLSGQSSGNNSPPASHWQGIINCLNLLLSILKDNYVPAILVQKIFTQIIAYINVQLFNSLLLRRECCSFGNGEYIKAGLAELEFWCGQAKEEYAGSSWDELKHIRQAVGFL
ncbi:Dilute domain, partial [Dillenia turbinata]